MKCFGLLCHHQPSGIIVTVCLSRGVAKVRCRINLVGRQVE